jgi:hypothetical protein
MSDLNRVYVAMADVRLWFKIQSNEDLYLSDIPSLIPLRWNYFKSEWQFIKQSLIDSADTYFDPDTLKFQIEEFSKFIESQRNVIGVSNPLSGDTSFYRFYSIYDNILVNSINLTNEEESIVRSAIEKTTAYSKQDFVSRKNIVRDYRDKLADIYTLNDEDYNLAYGRSSVPSQTPPTIVNSNELLNFHKFINTVDFILANLYAVDTALDPFAIARANANNPEVNIGQYAGGKMVRLQYGESLQDLADRFFNDRSRWIDIALANGLKPPFIDEIGERLSLLSNGNSNQINIAPTDLGGNLNIEKLYINQPVFLKSDVELFADQRSVISIKEVPVSGEIILELDGEANLDKYKTIDNAYIRIYKPNTTNSQFYTLIPTEAPPTNARQEETPWFLAKSADDEKNAKIDFGLSEGGDLNFSTNGDLSLSYGLGNAIQAIKLKMVTELGSLRYHPEYGLINVIGSSNNDIEDVKQLIISSISDQVAADPRFDRLETLTVDYIVGSTNSSAAGLAISLTVRLAGSQTILPISFTVNYR